jgi:hypothetical protein
MHKVASKLAPTGTEWFWLLWERARTRQLHAQSREQACSHRYRVVLAFVGACSHATASCTKSRASSLPQVPSGFGCCGSVLARDSFMHKVASKLAPTGTEWFWLLWERARTRQLRASRREQAHSYRYRVVLAVVGACSHATVSCTKSRASSLLQELSGIASRASSLPQVPRGFGCCGSVLARDSFMHKVASKLAPTGAVGHRVASKLAPTGETVIIGVTECRSFASQCVSARPASWSVWSSRVRVSISSPRSPCMILGIRYRVRLRRWSTSLRHCGKV